jgi:AcrR family transcriptional regulator
MLGNNMDERSGAVEAKIIQTTIDCIEKHGITGTTIRRIALMAGINVAAINYYFRSKDALLRRCMETTLANAFDLAGMPDMPGLGPQERCAAIMLEILEGGIRFPGLTRAHFHKLIAEGQSDSMLADSVNGFIEDLGADLRDRGCAMEPKSLDRALRQILSAVLMTALAPSLFLPDEKGRASQGNEGRAAVDRLVALLLI